MRASSFSLLYLQPNQLVLKAFQVCLVLSQKTSSHGILRICSRSLIFQPKNPTEPILRFKVSDGLFLRYLCNIGREQLSGIVKIGRRRDVREVMSRSVEEILRKMEKEGSIGESKLGRFFNGEEGDGGKDEMLDCVLVASQKIHVAPRRPISPYDTHEIHQSCIFNFGNSQRVSIERLLRYYDCIVNRSEDMTENRMCQLFIEEAYQSFTVNNCKNFRVKRVTIEGNTYAMLYMTQNGLIYQPVTNSADPQLLSVNIQFSVIRRIEKYRYMFQHIGVEIWQVGLKESMLLIFQNNKARQEFLQNIKTKLKLYQQPTLQELTKLWQQSIYSNYQYLLQLNTRASRSLNDASSYPIFPWVINEYQQKYNLLQIQNYRDLSKPVGAINPHRLKRLKSKLTTPPTQTNRSGPPFLYPTFISLKLYTQYFLLRKYPQLLILLQNTLICPPERIFTSMYNCYFSSMNSVGDFKELTPEFYDVELGLQCFVNAHAIPLGNTKDGKGIDDVELPEWANGPEDFIRKHRACLEAEVVGKAIHNWIDLVFGYKSLKENRGRFDNQYNVLCYEESTSFEGPVAELQITQFGQHPPCLFPQPHPKRGTLTIPNSLPLPQQSGTLTKQQQNQLQDITSNINKLRKGLEQLSTTVDKPTKLQLQLSIQKCIQISSQLHDFSNQQSLGSDIQGEDLDKFCQDFAEQLDLP